MTFFKVNNNDTKKRKNKKLEFIIIALGKTVCVDSKYVYPFAILMTPWIKLESITMK